MFSLFWNLEEDQVTTLVIRITQNSFHAYFVYLKTILAPLLELI